MTRRERLERKVEKRQEWADGRREKAGQLYASTDRYRGDVAFNTQPGHIPERARVIRMEDRAHEHRTVAAHHDAKAAGLEAQLERSIFDDDPDALEQLAARITANEERRERMKVVNALYRKGDAANLAVLGLDLERLRADVARHVASGFSWVKVPHEGWELSNLGARIRGDRERMEAIRARRARTEQATAAGGVVIDGGEWVRVTFADKPARAILDALKAAGFRWGSGSWVGRRDQVPPAVVELAAAGGAS